MVALPVSHSMQRNTTRRVGRSLSNMLGAMKAERKVSTFEEFITSARSKLSFHGYAFPPSRTGWRHFQDLFQAIMEFFAGSWNSLQGYI
eukprot:2143440-Amphidinium_carterae.1